MEKKITIAIDAMGGENSPNKVIDGIIHHNKANKNCFYKIFGDETKIKKIVLNILEIFIINSQVIN